MLMVGLVCNQCRFCIWVLGAVYNHNFWYYEKQHKKYFLFDNLYLKEQDSGHIWLYVIKNSIIFKNIIELLCTEYTSNEQKLGKGHIIWENPCQTWNSFFQLEKYLGELCIYSQTWLQRNLSIVKTLLQWKNILVPLHLSLKLTYV